MDEQSAVAIVRIARDAGFIDESPDDIGRLVPEAEKIFEDAKEARSTGNLDDSAQAIVDKIIELGEATRTEDPKSTSEPMASDSSNNRSEPHDEADPGTRSEPGGDESSKVGSEPRDDSSNTLSDRLRDVVELRSRSLAKIKQMRLPVPNEPGEDLLEMPRDLTTYNDHQLRRLHSEQNALYTYVIWAVACEESDFAAATHILEGRIRQARSSVSREDEHGKKRLADDIEAEIKQYDDVAEWMDRQQGHSVHLRSLKALRDIYQSNLERISREWSMRKPDK